jgi:predicted transcriptional regulator
MSLPLSSFDSDELTCFDIVRALFALSDNELEILACINHNQPVDIKSITAIIPKDRASIVRSIQRLMAVGVVRKEKVSLERGGYKYLYYSLPMSEFRERLSELIKRINKRMEKAILDLTEEKCREMYKNVENKYKSLII